MNDMEFRDIVSIFFQIFDNIGSLWNWYIVGLIAIVGWMLSDKKHLSNSEKQFIKILITLGFLLLVFFNYQSLIKNYELLDAVTIELQERLNSNPFETTQIHNQIRDLSFKDAELFVREIHIPIDIIMFVLIWFELISGKIQYYWGKLKNKLNPSSRAR